ncbi:MAG: ATP-binding protein [Eubacterium sp.]|nr:ATP-binding protein [Eubacterium sp.]
MKILELEARVENLPRLLQFTGEELEARGCSMKTQMQLDIAVEEIFVNVAHYAYGGEPGPVRIVMDISGDPEVFSISFMDQGTPYDPLAKEDPDVTLSAEEREIGGLGIFMVKKSMDDMKYEYRDGCNILTLYKKL